VIFIDETGAPVPADYLAAWLAEDIVEIGAASSVNASRALQQYCIEHDKAYHQEPVGWIYIQNALMQHNLDLGAEKSGHIFFKEAHNAEAPLLCLLLVLKKLNGNKLVDAISPMREQFHSSIEYNYKVTDRDKVLAAAKNEFSDLGELDEADGVLIESEGSWLSLRASNTEPLIRITWEAQDADTYSILKQRAESFIEQYTSK
jgi:phosphomannomutase